MTWAPMEPPEPQTTGIPAPVVLTMIRRLLEFPYPQICRHLVAAELLAALVEHGHTMPEGLISATWNAHDEEALDLMKELSHAN